MNITPTLHLPELLQSSWFASETTLGHRREPAGSQANENDLHFLATQFVVVPDPSTRMRLVVLLSCPPAHCLSALRKHENF